MTEVDRYPESKVDDKETHFSFPKTVHEKREAKEPEPLMEEFVAEDPRARRSDVLFIGIVFGAIVAMVAIRRDLIMVSTRDKVKKRMEVYAEGFEAVALSGVFGEVGDNGYAGPRPECEHDAVVTSGKIDEMLLEDAPVMGSRDAVFVRLSWSTHTGHAYEKIREHSGRIVVLGERYERFNGQGNALRATLSVLPESDDVLECTGAVDLLRAPADMILRHAPEGCLRSNNAMTALTEIVARLQEVCLVALTPSFGGGHAWTCRKELMRDAQARRKTVPAVPETHSEIVVSPGFAEELAERLREALLLDDVPAGVEFCLRDMYKKRILRMPWDGVYPLNHVRAHIGISGDLETLPDPLPTVSVVTITRNRPRMFALATYNFNSLDYPRELLEWVIVDDSDPGLEARRSLGGLSRDKRVRYVRLELQEGQLPLNVGLKRNIGCKVATGDVFMNMDDDDYVSPHSIRTRLAAMKSTGARCAGSTSTLCYDSETNKTFYCGVNDICGDPTCFAEPSMMYTRAFWKEKNWDKSASHGEGRVFLESRKHEDLVDVPSCGNVVCITHKNNMTMSLRTYANGLINDPDAMFGRDFARLLRAVT